MRKRNRKVNRHSRFTVNTAGVVALLVTGFAMVMCYCVLGMRCTSIAQELQEAEKNYKQLTREGDRVAARWAELMAGLDNKKLNLFGLDMDLARQDQVVRMNAKGRPEKGQIAVTRARARMASASMAQVAPETQSRKRLSRGKVR